MYPSTILFAMISICTINVNGMYERAKHDKVLASLRGINCDIYLLQETHTHNQNEGKQWEMDWGGPEYFSPSTNRSAGVGFLVNPRSQIKIVSTKSDKMGRIITAKLEHTNTPNSVFQILDLYAPNIVSDRKAFFDTLCL